MRCPRRWKVHSAVLALALASCALSSSSRGGENTAGLRRPAPPVHVKILALNDFHGQLSAGKKLGGRPVGSAPVLASYLEAARAGVEDETLLVHAGDLVGASPVSSSLLREEPAILFMNLFANAHCSAARPLPAGDSPPDDPRCNLVGTLGNHEFDRGRTELMRLLRGGRGEGPAFEEPYPGARFPYVSANVVDAVTRVPILPPYVIREVHGVRVAFVGAILRDAPGVIAAKNVAGLAFLDEAESVNRVVPEIQRGNVHAIVLLLHQGGSQDPHARGAVAYPGPVSGAIVEIVSRLDPDVDLVVSGHTHAFTNALLPNAGGRPVLVTQAYSAGSAFADIDLEIDPQTQDVVGKTAAIVTTWADAGAGLKPDASAAELTRKAERAVAPLTERLVATAAAELRKAASASGESALGDLIADAQRASVACDLSFTNPGGIRAGIPAGSVTWGALYAVQPFGNALVRMKLSGAQVAAALEAQWAGEAPPRILQVSGLTYSWSEGAPAGEKVSAVRVNGEPLDPAARYCVTVNEFLAEGGDGFGPFARGTDRSAGPTDLEALVSYLRTLPQPFAAPPLGRITRLP